MKTIFLAAGKSTRIAPLSDKNLLEFCGVPLLIQLLKNAQKGGLENFVIVANNENQEVIIELLLEYHLQADIVQQEKLEDGMLGGVLAGLTQVEDGEELFVLGGNDMVESGIYKQIIKECKNLDGGILAKNVEQYFPGGYLKIDSNNKILEIIEKPGEGKEPSNLVNIVGHYFKKASDLKEKLKKYENSSHKKGDEYEQALQELFKEKHYKAVQYKGFWNAIKYPWHVLDMMNYFLENQNSNYIAKTAKIADTAKIKGENIYIDEGVRVFENAVIQGPCYIGKNSIIGNNALVRNSMLGENCEIGFTSEVARSYLRDNVGVHHAYIGDSVVDSDVNFGAFSVTTNLRLDKKNIKVSIKEDRIDSGRSKLGAIVGKNAMIGSGGKLMPGCKLSPNAIVMPNEVKK
jgi:bifunctional UDP-N-acetylglucosamine pyrophosphorylase/glucosamine-1-phosphate N-acetyltransferase